MSSINRKEKEKQLRKDDIVAAAEELFFKKGFHGTTMDEIAKKAEFTKMTVYSYFTSKEEIFYFCSLKSLRILNRLFEDAAAAGGTGFDKVAAIGSAYMKFFKDYRSHFRVLTQAIHYCPSVACTPVLRELERENTRMFAIMTSAIEKGINDGTLRKDIEPGKLALLLVSISSGFYRFLEEHNNGFTHLSITTEDEFLSLGLNLISNAIKPIDVKKH
jgi:AcrR family transcriptional regulator